MTKLVLFIVGPALGHITRSLAIATALSSKIAFQICFASTNSNLGKKLVPHKFKFYPLPFKNEGDEIFADGLEQLISQLRPDLICLDLSPTPWLNLVKFPDIQQLFITNYFLTSTCNYITVQESYFNEWRGRINHARIDRGLEPIVNIKKMYDRDAVLLCDPPELIRTHNDVPSHFHAVGPCFWEPVVPLPKKLNSIKEILFLSFGSTGKKRFPAWYAEKIALAVGAKEIIWLSSRSIKNTKKLPSNHHVYPWLPPSQILARSRFVITHGGAGSTYQALAHGVPLSIWPSHENQKILGTIIHDQEYGAPLEDKTASIEYLENNFIAMQSRSRGLAESLKYTNGPENAANKIIDMMN